MPGPGGRPTLTPPPGAHPTMPYPGANPATATMMSTALSSVTQGPAGGPGPGLGQGSVTSVVTMASSTRAPPTTPGQVPGANPTFEVKETTDVKRNKAKLPTLTHAKPTRGDWLKKRYIVNNYILLDTLGTGSYGEVRLCKDRTTDQLFAIKIISKEFLKKRKGGNSNETYFEDIRREIAIMKKLKHPNVLRLFEVRGFLLSSSPPCRRALC
jgi:hypothetical protein